MKLNKLILPLMLFFSLGGSDFASAAQGQQKTITVTEGTAMAASVSPDGKFLAMDLQGSLWVLPVSGGRAEPITDAFNDARQPVWSSDSTFLYYFAFTDGGYDLWRIKRDGSERRQITSGPFDDREPAISPDGTKIAFSSDRENTYLSYDIWVLDMTNGDITSVTDDAYENRMPVWTADGKGISFSTQRNGNYQIRTASLNGGDTLVKESSHNLSPMAWLPSQKLLYSAADGKNHVVMKLDDEAVTKGEGVFEFKTSISSNGDIVYVSDGQIRKRSVDDLKRVDTIRFSAKLDTLTPEYTKSIRDFTSDEARPVLGIMRPALSPDGKQIAFVALGDLYLMKIGDKPRKLTDDQYMEADPAWSPDGTKIVYSSDNGDHDMQLWVHDLTTGKHEKLLDLVAQPLGAAWSPDGSKIAYLSVDKMWGEANLGVVDIATKTSTLLSLTLKQPGKPTWSADSTRIALSLPAQYSHSFREGTNQVMVFPLEGEAYWSKPVENLSLDTRGGGGPVWSPDGNKMAGIYGGELNVWPVDDKGMPIGPPRSLTSEIAHNPSWSADSTEILYQSNEQLKKINVFTGEITPVPFNLTYQLAKPKGMKVIHVSYVFDGESQSLLEDQDIFIKDNMITKVAKHSDSIYDNYEVIEAKGKYAIPGLIESHVHPQKDFGQGAHRAWLAFGITTLRDPGNQPYHGVEDREASEAGVRIGPRIFTTGHLMEWQRVYYKMGIAIAGPAHLDKELKRAKALKYDLLKSYVRLPDSQQKKLVEYGHNEMGVEITTHEIYPASKIGVDRVEHLGATSRRGYSPKHIGGRAFDDARQLMDKVVTPTMFGSLNILIEAHPELQSDPRLALYPEWTQESVKHPMNIPGSYLASLDAQAKTLKALYDNGTKITAGTDLVLAMNLHGELNFYVNKAGLTPYQALRTATAVPAEVLELNAGMIKADKLADIVLLDANPLEDITNTTKVNTVITNGQVFTMEQLLDTAYSGK